MASPRTHTAHHQTLSQSVPDEEENDVDCILCVGECTCLRTHPRSLPPPTPSTSHFTASFPVLKIKLPAGARAGMPPKRAEPTIASSSSSIAHNHLPAHPKKRGRPTKAMAAARAAAAASDIIFSGPNRPVRARAPAQARNTSSQFRAKAPRPKPKVKGTTGNVRAAKKNNKRKRRRDDSDCFDESDSDLLSDVPSAQFPTFVSASAVSSSDLSSSDSSDTDSDSTIGFGTDSSVEEEEESYIISDENRQHARVRRELLGDDAGQKKRDHRHENKWEIKPRKKSVGLSDAEMEVDSESGHDSDATEDDDQEEKEADADEEDMDDGEITDDRGGYAGIATGWSDEDDDTFDADVFFANLSSGESDDEESPLASSMQDVETPVVIARPGSADLRNSWDPHSVFTAGAGMEDPASALHMLDLDLRLAHTSAPAFGAADSEMPSTSDRERESGAGSPSGASDGDTTEDDFVDDAGLPTPRAMALFRWPTTISAVNPLNTVSPQARRAAPRVQPGPRPADILAGRVYYDSEEEEHDRDDAWARGRRPSVSRKGAPAGPRMGNFDLGEAAARPRGRSVVIDGSKADAPSPFPRRRARSSLHRSLTESLSSSGPSMRLTDMLSDSQASATTDVPSTDSMSMGLDDVLDASLLTADGLDAHTLSGTESERDGDVLARWEFIPMGAFRQAAAQPAALVEAGGGLLASPVLLREDGGRTPRPELQSPSKTRRESRQEKRLKRRAGAANTHQPPYHHQGQQSQHHHHHHANGRGRGANAVQRMGSHNGSPGSGN